jgi:CBS domain-containing protein
MTSQQSLSVMVIDVQGRGSKFISFLDIIFQIVSVVEHKVGDITQENMRDLTIDGKEIGNYPVSEVAGLSMMNPFITLPQDATVASALDEFAVGVQRIATVNNEKDQTVTGIVT